MKLQTILDLYQQEKPQLSPRTIQKYRSVIKILIKDTGLDNIFLNRDVCIKWRNHVLKRSSAANANNYHRHLKALFSFAVEIGIIKENVFKSFKLLKAEKTKPKIIHYATLQKLLKLIKTDAYYSQLDWFYLAMLDILSYTAIRRRQLIGIKWCDVDFNNAQLYLSATFSKNNKDNIVPLTPSLVKRLATLKSNSGKIGQDDQVFNITKFIDSYHPNSLGETTERHISGLFSRFSKKLDELISPHRFRHTFATKIADNSGNLKALSEFLTHSDTRTTMMYVHPDIDSKRKIQDLL